jgi:hypothetical protein
MGRISVNNMAGHKPVKEHANRGQVLLYGGSTTPIRDEPM